MVGLLCNPKNDSLIEVPLPLVPVPVTALLVIAGREGLTPLLSLVEPDTEDFTAAKTTLANEMPDVEPKCRESEGACIDTFPKLGIELFFWEVPDISFPT